MPPSAVHASGVTPQPLKVIITTRAEVMSGTVFELRWTHYHKNIIAMKKYRCTVCDYIYDPAVGDPDSGIEAGTPFENLPDDWVCPLCGESKSAFEPVE